MLSSNKKPAFRRVALDAVNGSPSLHRFVAARFPTDNLRSDLQTRFQIERERGFVLKDNFNDAVIGRDGKFHFGNDFAFCRWKLLDALVRFLFGTLGASHFASLKAIWLGPRSWSHTGASRKGFIAGSQPLQSVKSKLGHYRKSALDEV
jgi:hypothetical protein